MANATKQKRPGGSLSAGSKKRKRQRNAYHSGSDSAGQSSEDEGQRDFDAVNLFDSDDEALEKSLADDGATSDSGSESGDSLDSLNEGDVRGREKKPLSPAAAKRTARARPVVDRASESQSDDDMSSEDSESAKGRPSTKSKRNDPTTFSTSLHKILSTKLSSTRRADPVLSRSADAREASRRIVDAALEEKARRQLRFEKRAALEKGRVKDVLVASSASQLASGPADSSTPGAQETTATILETERRLRKVAQRGVVQLFNAVRAAQVKAAQAKKLAKAEGILGMDKREAKVTEMSRKGFLDLVASGGGGLKQGALEEA